VALWRCGAVALKFIGLAFGEAVNMGAILGSSTLKPPHPVLYSECRRS